MISILSLMLIITLNLSFAIGIFKIAYLCKYVNTLLKKIFSMAKSTLKTMICD